MRDVKIDIQQLNPAERLELLERLWDSLSAEPSNVPLTESQRRELDRRLNALDADRRRGEPLGVPWEDVLRQLRTSR